MASATSDGQPFISQIQLPESQSRSQSDFADCAHRTEKTTNTKRIIVCCDGTWNNSSVSQDIADVYRFVCDNYNPGDEIFIVGFSRGAFTARSVSGLICNLGLLNRVGLSQFGAIFHDYQTFPNWKYPGSFDKDDHLVGFTLTNFMRRKKQKASEDDKVEERESAALEEELNKDKRMFFETMTTYRENRKGYGPMDLRKMAEKYRDRLEEHGMVLTKWETQFRDGQLGLFPVPTDVNVRAVGQSSNPKPHK
ncbi:hypothetical protein COL516b_003860 [Colletotrichum fioriniae]|nr:uncharacterized protein COL516b_003860 [Colletotrichum fioriniae]KAJ0307888.1 hypothetical protein COL516b_003860 [Colletotrichum fioriniae]